MSDDRNVRVIMEFLSASELKVTDGAPIDVILKHAESKRMSFDELQSALILASLRGWILLTETNCLHLTETGYAILNVANDNPPPPPPQFN